MAFNLASEAQTNQFRISPALLQAFHTSELYNPGMQTATQSRGPNFMDLPAESRNSIYEELLVTDSVRIPIGVFRHRDGRGKELVQKDSRRYWKRTTNKHRGKFDQKTKTWLPKPASKLSILSTCKQVHQEAVAVLYGKQTFEFIHMRELRDCLPLLGNNIKYLRFISVSTYGYVADRKSAREVLKTLVAAKGLRKIYLSHFELCKETVENAHGHHEVAHKSPALTAEELVKNAEPLLRSLHVSYKGHNLSVMDLLEIELRGPCVHQWYSHPRPGHRFGPAGYPRSCKSLCICGTESQCNEKKQAEVRDEIAKLGLDST